MRNPRKNVTKELQKFRDFGASRAQNSLISVSIRYAIEHIRKKFANEFQNFGMPPAEKKCVHSASVRCTTLATSLQLLVKSDGLFRSEKVRVRRRDHAKSAQKFHERIAKFPEFRRATSTEFVSLGQRSLHKPYDVTEALDRVHRAFRS